MPMSDPISNYSLTFGASQFLSFVPDFPIYVFWTGFWKWLNKVASHPSIKGLVKMKSCLQERGNQVVWIRNIHWC